MKRSAHSRPCGTHRRPDPVRRGGGACGRKCADVPACCGQVLQWFTAKLRSVTGESEAEEDSGGEAEKDSSDESEENDEPPELPPIPIRLGVACTHACMSR